MIEDFERVLNATRGGEEWAAGVLFSALQPPLLRYLRWKEPNVAEDIAGETWAALAENIGRFEGDEAALRVWMFSVARRRLADHRRRVTRRRTRPVGHEDLMPIACRSDTAELVVDSVSAQEAIAALTAALSPDQAEVLVLRVVGGMKVDDVASLLGKRPGTVHRVLQHRALRQLAGHPATLEVLVPGL